MSISTKIKIVAISGSLREGSSNHAILRYLGGMAPVDVDYVMYDGLAQLPHFDPGLDSENIPQPVIGLRALWAEADGVVICSPEYAFGVPGSLKNLLDWTVGSGSLDGKPLALITASTGGEHAYSALKLILKNALGADLMDEAALLIPSIRAKMDGNGKIIDPETIEKLRFVFEKLLNSIS